MVAENFGEHLVSIGENLRKFHKEVAYEKKFYAN